MPSLYYVNTADELSCWCAWSAGIRDGDGAR